MTAACHGNDAGDQLGPVVDILSRVAGQLGFAGRAGRTVDIFLPVPAAPVTRSFHMKRYRFS